jgi:hypothetical protein
MKCRNRGSVPNLFFFGLRAAHPTKVPKAFGPYTSLLQNLKKAFGSTLSIDLSTELNPELEIPRIIDCSNKAYNSISPLLL